MKALIVFNVKRKDSFLIFGIKNRVPNILWQIHHQVKDLKSIKRLMLLPKQQLI